MDQLAGLRVFRAAVESGSLSAAAELLDMSTPMVSKRLAQLERRLNSRLLHRTSRHLNLTEAGSTYYEQCRLALDIIDSADAAIGSLSDGVRGQLKVSAPVWCANPQFTAALAEHRRRFPEVVLDLHLANRHVDLVAEGFDLALRATHMPSPTLIARPLCPIRFQMVASPEFIKKLNTVNRDQQTPVVDAIVPNYVDLEALMAKPAKGAPRVRLNVTMRSNDTTLTYHAVRAGVGAALLPEWVVAADLKMKRLIALWPNPTHRPNHTLFAVYTSRQYMAPKLRTFIDFMSEAARAW